MALAACLFSAMNCTRDEKNLRMNSWGKMARRNTGNPQGTGSTRYQFRLIAEVQDGRGFNNGIHRFYCFLLAACVSGRNGKRIPQNSQNPHIYLHVPEMTHGTHEARSSPFGSRSPSPKELRINSYPPHNI
jgi:hypothetical protein